MSQTRKNDRAESNHTNIGRPVPTVNSHESMTFDRVYRSHYELVYGLCRRMLRNPTEAEDATQEVFFRVLLKLHTFRGESALSSWLYQVTKNLVLMRLRKSSRELVPLTQFMDSDADCSCEIGKLDLYLSGAVDRIDLEVAAGLLPEGFRTMFFLHDVQGFKHQEIAGLFGCSAGNCKSQLHKARRRLRMLLGDR